MPLDPIVPSQTKRRPPKPKYRPISTADNIQTTGQLSNPVGAMTPVNQNTNNASAAMNYYMNPAQQIQNLPPVITPGAGAYGAQGAPYSMLPSSPTPNTYGQQNQQKQYAPNPNRLKDDRYTPPQTNFGTANSFSGWNTSNTQQVSMGLAGQQFDQAAKQYELTGTVNPASLPASISTQTQEFLGYGFEQMQAMGYTFNGTTWTNPQAVQPGRPNNTGAPAGAGSDFMGTNFMQYNTANNVSFTNQLRWDPARKQYVKIGRLINEGRLDVRGNGKLKRAKHGRGGHADDGGGGGGGGQQQTQGNADYTGSFGSANFNTGTG